VVRFFTPEGLNPADIHIELIPIYGVVALFLQAFDKWHNRFFQGRTELCDNSRYRWRLESEFVESVRAMSQEYPFT
jgi:hypothetical protein